MAHGRILLVEDSDEIAENIFEFLEPSGLVLDRAADGISGLHLAVVNEYDVIVLDLMLPGISGLDICQRLRADAKKQTPILMLTAKDSMPDKLAGFRAGADDYLVKPFGLAELEARIHALINRSQQRGKKLRVGGLQFDLGTLQVTRDGQPVTLSRAGERILEVLMQRYPEVVRRRDLEYALWGDEPPDSDALRSHIYSLRNAIDKPFGHKMIETVHRYGFRLNPEDP